MAVGVWMAAVDVPRPPAYVQGGPAWTGGKPSGRQSSPQPALSVCLCLINVALARVLILVPEAMGRHAAASSIIFPSRNMGVCDYGREWDPSPCCPQQAVI